MAPRPRSPRLFLAFVVPLLVIFSNTPTDKIHMLSLKQRLGAFYREHAPSESPTDARLERLVNKHKGQEASINQALQSKYGATLPPEDLLALLAREDAMPRVVYVVNRAASKVVALASEGATAHGAHVPEDVAGRWKALKPTTRLGIAAVAGSLVSSMLPTGPGVRMASTVIVLATALAHEPPSPAELSPTALAADVSDVWGDTRTLAPASSEWLLIVRRRLGLIAGGSLLARSLVSRSAAPSLLVGSLTLCALATNPAVTVPYEELGFVQPNAKRRFVNAMRQRDTPTADGAGGAGGAGSASVLPLVHTFDFGVLSLVALHDDPHNATQLWESNVVALGLAGRWHATATVSATAKGLTLSGVSLPVYALPLMLLPLVAVAVSKYDDETPPGARLASAALLALCAVNLVFATSAELLGAAWAAWVG